jgi:endo-1,4-beta-xylanase
LLSALAGLVIGGCNTRSAVSHMVAPAAPLGDASSGEGASADGPRGDAGCGVPGRFHWSSTGPILSPVSDATHHLVAIKDPSIVYYNGKWHVFVSTVAVGGIYSMAYVSFPDFDHTSSASFYYLDQNPALAGYHAAPQVFYFRPQSKWYLVFQSGPPQYSTNDDVSNPAGWSAPVSFFRSEPAVVTENKGPRGGWLDFKVICDSVHCSMFFSDDNGTFYRSQTTIGDFPHGFGNAVVVMKDSSAHRLFEASNVYSMKGTGQYLALVEAFDAESSYHRYYRSWIANRVDGTWTPLQDTFAEPFASTADIAFTGTPWTSDISHGEMIRDGYDETMTVDACARGYLYQGYDPSAPNDAGYNGIPWKLGLLTRTD